MIVRRLISRIFFFWLDSLVWRAWRKGRLEQEDLHDLPDSIASENLNSLFNKYWSSERKKKKPCLWVPLIKCVWKRLILSGALYALQICVLIGQSLLIGVFVEYFSPSSTDREETRIYMVVAVFTVLLYALPPIFTHQFFITYVISVHWRVIVTGATYQKALRLSPQTLAKVTNGHVINLISNDARRLDEALHMLHPLWFFPIAVVAVGLITWREIGPSSLAGLAITFLMLILQLVGSRLLVFFRSKSVKITDKRVKVMNEVISGMRVIKMYAWEYAFKRVVEKIRGKEIRLLKGVSMVFGVNLALYFISLTLTSYAVFGLYWKIEGQLPPPHKLFTVMALFQVLIVTGVNYVSHGLYALSEAYVAIRRVQRFLCLEEVPSHACAAAPLPVGCDLDLDPSPSAEVQDSKLAPASPEIVCKGVSVWNEGYDKPLFEGINFEVNKNQKMLAIIGPVGAGKSSLLQCLLKEQSVCSGEVRLAGSVALVPQEPWVFSGTIRDNILFGFKYEKERYAQVLHASSLQKDMDRFPCGDLTLIGERGVGLSGGQRSRLGLARALYRNADVYLLDDPLGAVDPSVCRHLFQECIQSFLKEKLVILVTHQLHLLQEVDRILVLANGKAGSVLTWDQLEKWKGKRSVRTIQDTSRQEGGLGKRTDSSAIQEELENRTDSYTVQEELENRTIVHENRTDSSSTVQEGLEVSNGLLDYLQMMMEDNGTAADNSVTDFEETSDDVYASNPVPVASSVAVEEELLHMETEGVKMSEEDKVSGKITMMSYAVYFWIGGGLVLTALTIASYFLGEANLIAADLWLSEWSASNCTSITDQHNVTRATSTLLGSAVCTLSSGERLAVYSGLVGSCFLTLTLRSLLFMYVCLTAVLRLHNRMLSSILRAPMRFFETNSLGRIINRFSRDLSFMEDQLPFFFAEFTQLSMHILGALVISALVNYWLVIPSTVLITVFILLRAYFITACCETKRLEAISRSPLYAHVSTTLLGLPSIRSCSMEGSFLRRFHEYQDSNTKGWYFYLGLTRWFGLRIDSVSATFTVIVIFCSVLIASDSIDVSTLGLALTYLFNISYTMQFTVRISTDVESLMVSTERVLAYTRLPHEAPLGTVPPQAPPPCDWPRMGGVVMKDMTFSYAPNTPPVLKSLSLLIHPGEKVGVVGRTGAGKSSLVNALFRLAEPQGLISIDGICTGDIGLHELRRSMAIIPQDPVLFSGSVRYNLDPFEQYSDADLWDVLEQVELKKFFEGQCSGLDCLMSEAGSNFSVGQRQLVCLARALLRRNKILVLDEATANVDMKTDTIIQKTLKQQFGSVTVLTIAHRLNTIMDSDRIMVMEAGQLKEFGAPHELLEDPASLLSSMVREMGRKEGRRLSIMAQAYKKPKLSSKRVPPHC